jgi:alpha-beta hydrolase superfamily lysophospholipase
MGQKEAYQEKIEAQIKEWSAKLQELKAKAEKATADKKIELNKAIDDMRARKEAAQVKLEEIKGASAETWEKLKVAMDKAMEDVKTFWEGIKSRFQ